MEKKNSDTNEPGAEAEDVPTFRRENIVALSRVVAEDEFQEDKQYDATFGGEAGLWPDQNILPFVTRNMLEGKVLEIGCGTGQSFLQLPITHAIEPCLWRLAEAQKRSIGVSPKMEVRAGYAECLPDEWGNFDTVLFILGFFQVRSDYEALIEINRVLKPGGRFIFNLQGDERDHTVGRALGVRNYTRICKDFGFEPVEIRAESGLNRTMGGEVTQALFCVQKERDFRWQALRKMQLVKKGTSGLCRVLNGDFDGRDRGLL